jgi:hypothetical protein
MSKTAGAQRPPPAPRRLRMSGRQLGIPVANGCGLRQAVRVSDQMHVRVSMADLRDGLALLLDELERKCGPVVDLAADYYWTVDRHDAFRFDTTDTPEITVGQLSDDIALLKELLVTANDRPIVLWHDLAHVVGILARLAAMDAPTFTDPNETPQHRSGMRPLE